MLILQLLYILCNSAWAAEILWHLVRVQDAWQQALVTGAGSLPATSDATLLCAAESVKYTREE